MIELTDNIQKCNLKKGMSPDIFKPDVEEGAETQDGQESQENETQKPQPKEDFKKLSSEVSSEIPAEIFTETSLDTPANISTEESAKENRTPPFLKFSNVPCGTPENLENINKAIQEAFTINKDFIAKRADRLGIKFNAPDFYIPIAIKESKLNNSEVSSSGAVGYFQITKTAVRDVNNWFEKDFTMEEAKTNPAVNALLGILLFHLYKDRYSVQNKLNFASDKDRELFATFAYNAGIGVSMEMWKNLQVTTYKEFESEISKLLIKAHAPFIQESADQDKTANDYNVFIRLPYSQNFFLKMLAPLTINRKIIEAGGQLVTTATLMEALNFTAVISSIRSGNYAEKNLRGPSN